MKRAFLFFALLALAACARPVSQAPELPADEIWQKMLAASAAAQGPYRMQLSMRFGEEGNTRRVTAVLWGNGDADIRLDVMAGVGATVAMVAETRKDFVVYTPQDNKAYYNAGPNRPVLKIGIPVPFDLGTLAEILNGNLAAAFGNAPVSSAPLENGNVAYELGGQLAGTLELDSVGAPVSWRQESGGWRMQFTNEDEAPYLPHSVKLSNRQGQMAIILIKEREQVKQPFDASQLKLAVPAGIPMLPLTKFTQS